VHWATGAGVRRVSCVCETSNDDSATHLNVWWWPSPALRRVAQSGLVNHDPNTFQDLIGDLELLVDRRILIREAAVRSASEPMRSMSRSLSSTSKCRGSLVDVRRTWIWAGNRTEVNVPRQNRLSRGDSRARQPPRRLIGSTRRWLPRPSGLHDSVRMSFFLWYARKLRLGKVGVQLDLIDRGASFTGLGSGKRGPRS